MKTDVSKAAQVKELVERTLQKFGRLDIAFNNGGIEQVPKPFLEQVISKDPMNSSLRGWLNSDLKPPV